VAALVAGRVEKTQGRISAKRLLPAARAAGYAGSPRNFRRLVAGQKALWRREHHRGRRPAVWSPGEYLVIDWGSEGGLQGAPGWALGARLAALSPLAGWRGLGGVLGWARDNCAGGSARLQRQPRDRGQARADLRADRGIPLGSHAGTATTTWLGRPPGSVSTARG